MTLLLLIDRAKPLLDMARNTKTCFVQTLSLARRPHMPTDINTNYLRSNTQTPPWTITTAEECGTHNLKKLISSSGNVKATRYLTSYPVQVCNLG